MRVKQAYFYSSKEDEYLILTANKNQTSGWYDALPVKVHHDTNWITRYDHCEFGQLKDVPAHYKRMSTDDCPTIIRNIARGELE